LAGARKDRKHTVGEIANRLGVSVVTLEGWESGACDPRANRLAQLAGILGVSVFWLLTGEGEWEWREDERSEPIDGLEGQVTRAEILVTEISSLLVEIRAQTRRLQREIDDDGDW
jgi:transcriptional regulator with XRE-family HTH domain